MKKIKTYEDFVNEEINLRKGLMSAALGAGLALSNPSYSQVLNKPDSIEISDDNNLLTEYSLNKGEIKNGIPSGIAQVSLGEPCSVDYFNIVNGRVSSLKGWTNYNYKWNKAEDVPLYQEIQLLAKNEMMYYNYYIPSNDTTLSEEEKKSLPYMIKTKSSFKVWSKAEYWGKNTTVFIVDNTTSEFESGDITDKVGKEPYVIKSNDYLKNKDNWILPEEPILTFVEEEANFIGGYTELNNYIKKNMKYPSIAKDMGISGKVIVKFIVEKDGSISNVEVESGMTECKECNEEAIRLLKNSPKWKPAKNDGKSVRTIVRIPIKFDK